MKTSPLVLLLCLLSISFLTAQSDLKISIKQDGKKKKPTDHTFYLKKKPFQFIIYQSGPGDLLFNAAYQEKFYALAEAGAPLTSFSCFEYARLRAESPGIQNKDLCVSAHSYNNWYYRSDAENHFHSYKKKKNGSIYCTREIEEYTIFLSGFKRRTYPIIDIPEDKVYLVFAKKNLIGDVIAVEWFTIVFIEDEEIK